MSNRPRIALLGFALLAFSVALGVGFASASKEVITYFGTESGSGTLGGQFKAPRDIAVNKSGVGPANPGDIYVADDENNRVERFDKDGNFISAWGADVVQEGKPGDVAGTNPFEVCTNALDCKAGVASGGNAFVAGNGTLNRPQSVAVDGDTGLVYVSDRTNRRVDVYDGAGVFQRAFGFDVAEAGPGNTGTTFEICVAANADVCKAGTAGAGVGQIGNTTTAGTLGIAISQPDGNAATGKVFLADSQNRRVVTYELDGTAPASFGSSAVFGNTQPRKLAVDSRGVVYASNSNNGGEIERYDSLNANGGGAIFLAPITAADSIPTPGPLLTGEANVGGPSEGGVAPTATSGLAIDPDSDGAGTDEDTLYVLRDPFTGPTVVQQFGAVNDPGLVAAPTVVDDTHAAGAGFAVVTGLGLSETEGRLFVATTVGGHRVYILDDLAGAPTATLAPITTFDATSATFSGQVNPNGSLTGYHFEYVTDAQFQIDGFTSALKLPQTDTSAGFGVGNVAAAQQPKSLLPSTLYHVRLVAKRSFGSDSATTAPVTFTTSAAAPSIGTAPAYAKTNSATLAATVNPNSQATSYHFEYGTQGPCGVNPCISTAIQAAGSGSSETLVKAAISGLQPGTTYHYRLVASNSAGASNGPDRTIVTLAATAKLFYDRAYEMASPPDKSGSEVNAKGNGQALIQVTPSGDAAMFTSIGSFGGAASAPPINYYRASRDETGWSSQNISAPLPPHTVALPLIAPAIAANTTLSTVLWGAYPSPPALPGAVPDAFTPYVQTGVPAGPFEPLGDWPAAPPGESFEFGAVTPDFDHVVFESTEELVPGSPSGRAAYEWANGELRLVGYLPDGNLATSSTIGRTAHGQLTEHAISADGTRIFFTTSGGKLYMRENGTTTIDVSPSQRASADPAGAKLRNYEGASVEGSKVIFSTTEKLLDTDTDSSNDLYLYDIDSEVLRLISRDADLSDGNTEVGENSSAGVLGAGDDLSTVYFAANGRLLATQPRLSGPSVYSWHDDGSSTGVLRYVATVDAVDQGDNQNWSRFTNKFANSRVSPNGRYLLFTSIRKIGAYDNAGHKELYRYDSQEGRLDCVSCRPDGAPPVGDAALGTELGEDTTGIGTNFNSYLPRNVLDDGRVFFDSSDAILPGDSNGKRDVYEWRDGQISLITTGQSSSDSRFADANPSGDDVFFITREPLVGIDFDQARDLYDARVDGGLASQNPTFGVGCQGDACQPPPVTLSDSTPSSSSFQGPGNASPKPSKARCAKGKRKVRRNGKARCVKRHAKRTNHRNANTNRRASR